MMSCKDCIHNSVCELWRREEGQDAKFYAETEAGECEYFKYKSRFVELPCGIGAPLWWAYDSEIAEVSDKPVGAYQSHARAKRLVWDGESWGVMFEESVEKIGTQFAFLTKEDAMKWLAEKEEVK